MDNNNGQSAVNNGLQIKVWLTIDNKVSTWGCAGGHLSLSEVGVGKRGECM